MAYEEPHTHPLKKTYPRAAVDSDVIQLAIDIRDILKNEEMWYILQSWKSGVEYDGYLRGIAYATTEGERKDAEEDLAESRPQPKRRSSNRATKRSR